MQKKFTVLRVVGTIYKVLGWIVLVFGLLGACGMIAVGAMGGTAFGTSGARDALGPGLGGALGGALGGVIIGGVAIFYSLLVFLALYAFGDLIFLLISLEENTRLTAERLMEDRLARPAPSAPSPLPPPTPAP